MQPGSHYATRGELHALIVAYRTEQIIPDRLRVILSEMAAGIWARYRFGDDVEEYTQDALCALLEAKALEKVDVNRNVFSYLSTCLINHGRRIEARKATRAKAHEQYVTDYTNDHLADVQTVSAACPRMQRAYRLHASGDTRGARRAARKIAKVGPRASFQRMLAGIRSL